MKEENTKITPSAEACKKLLVEVLPIILKDLKRRGIQLMKPNYENDQRTTA